MKRNVWILLALFLALSLCLSLAACRKDGGKQQASSGTPDGALSSTPSGSAADESREASGGRDAADPADPGSPTDPADPGSPTDPADPGSSADPAGPGSSGSADPNDPSRPADPTDPDTSDDPEPVAPPPPDASSLVGRWMSPLDLGDLVALYTRQLAAEGESLPMLPDLRGITLLIELDLWEDGTGGYGINPESAAQAKSALHEPVKAMLVEYLADKGIDEATANELLASEGSSLDQMADETIEATIDLVKMAKESYREGRYQYEDGKLYFAQGDAPFGVYVTVGLEGDALSVVSCSDPAALDVYAELLPLVFTRSH